MQSNTLCAASRFVRTSRTTWVLVTCISGPGQVGDGDERREDAAGRLVHISVWTVRHDGLGNDPQSPFKDLNKSKKARTGPKTRT